MADLLLPHHCEACAEPAAKWLCPQCARGLEEIATRPACGFCAAPLPMPDAPCPRCLSRPRRLIRRCARLGVHGGVLRELIHRLKYERRWQIASRLAAELCTQRHVEEILADAEIIVPVPLHWRRRYSRGYNQSELLADALAAERRLPVICALRRVHHRATQTSLPSVFARLDNVKGAFEPARKVSRIEGRRIVLIDDVMTTGATLRSAARALRPHRPARIDAIVIAIADPFSRDFSTIRPQ